MNKIKYDYYYSAGLSVSYLKISSEYPKSLAMLGFALSLHYLHVQQIHLDDSAKFQNIIYFGYFGDPYSRHPCKPNRAMHNLISILAAISQKAIGSHLVQ